MPRPRLPSHVAALALELAGLPGALAVVLGGSRATATHRPDSDWDLGVYYRGSQRPLDPDDLRRLGPHGHVSELGEWGPIVHGGAWLTIDSTPSTSSFAISTPSSTGSTRRGRGASRCSARTAISSVHRRTCPSGNSPSASRSSATWRVRASRTRSRQRRPSAGADGPVSRCCSPTAPHVRTTRSAARECSPSPSSASLTRGSPGATGAELARTVAAVSTALGTEPLAVR